MNRLASPASRSSVIVDQLVFKMFCAGLQQQDSNQSLEEAIALADPNYYPNLHAICRALLTMPVGSVGKCSVSSICHSSDCSWLRQLDINATGDRSCLHPYASVEDCVRPLSGNDFLTVLSERFPEQTRPSLLAFQLLPSRVQDICRACRRYTHQI
jgi:hypothetical protein